MTTQESTHDDAHPSERKKAVEALTAALETEEMAEKNYHIREALQLLTLRDE